MNILSKKLFLVLTVCGLFFSCSSDDGPAADTPPGAVVNLEGIAQNEAVWLQWTNPTDTDLDKITISYNGVSTDIAKTAEAFKVEALTNKEEYTFEITVTDLAGNVSASTSVSATPDKYVALYDGIDVESGFYSKTESNGIIFDTTIDGANILKRVFLPASGNEYFWEGTLVKNNDATFTYELEYYGISNGVRDHVADLVQVTNAVFSFEYDDQMRFASNVNVYEKVEGDENFLEGTYSSFLNTTSEDNSSFDEMTSRTIEFTATNGVVLTVKGEETLSSWNNQDLLDEKYIFVKYNSKTYLIENPSEYLAKQ
ncbi:hypothetical protein [Cellulophaga baltica]|uniref:hypothetical protein n=1 Tax=Cellulophaga baltica TaxID=76594 RepID=UPI003F4AB0F4